MTPGGTMRAAARPRAVVALASAVLAGSALSGCTAVAQGGSGTTPASTPSGSVGATLEPSVTPAETCAQLIDINTLIVNAQAALTTGRIARQEFDGVARLAGRSAHRVDVAPGTDLAIAVSALQSAAGPYEAGGAMLPVDPESDEWTSAIGRAHDECVRAGVEFYVEMWTGG